MRIKSWWQAWRLRPGMEYAADMVERFAYQHPNSAMLGPEQNRMACASHIRKHIPN